jgi:hypothetical protein
MAKQQQSDLRRWALIGAEQRLVQLAEEAAAIHLAFPELPQRGDVEARLSRSGGAEGPNGRPRRRNRMSPAARKAVSERMKKYWASRRQTQGAETKQTASESKSARRGRSRRKLSAAARKRISDAQKARWAKQRATSGAKKKH